MKTGLDHLPLSKQREIQRLTHHLLTEFEATLSGAQQSWKKGGKILKIVLFGSFARGNWKEDRRSGYYSDFDILVVVNNKKLTDKAEYWYVAEEKIDADPGIRRPVTLIVHTMREVNEALTQGQFFFADIAQDGIVLYDVPGHRFTQPRPLSSEEASAIASQYFEDRISASKVWLETAKFTSEQEKRDRHWRNVTAFNLHQAAESAYHCFLLVWTFYQPASHNLKFLRSLAENTDDALVAAWPRSTRRDRRRFALLKEAYVKARYSPEYRIDNEDITALIDAVTALQDAVEASCRRRLETLKAAIPLAAAG